MQRDYLGNPVTGERDSTLRAIDEFIEGYLAYETRAECILIARRRGSRILHGQCVRGDAVDAAGGAGGRRARREVSERRRSARRRRATRREQLNSADAARLGRG